MSYGRRGPKPTLGRPIKIRWFKEGVLRGLLLVLFRTERVCADAQGEDGRKKRCFGVSLPVVLSTTILAGLHRS